MPSQRSFVPKNIKSYESVSELGPISPLKVDTMPEVRIWKAPPLIKSVYQLLEAVEPLLKIILEASRKSDHYVP